MRCWRIKAPIHYLNSWRNLALYHPFGTIFSILCSRLLNTHLKALELVQERHHSIEQRQNEAKRSGCHYTDFRFSTAVSGSRSCVITCIFLLVNLILGRKSALQQYWDKPQLYLALVLPALPFTPERTKSYWWGERGQLVLSYNLGFAHSTKGDHSWTQLDDQVCK